MDTKLRARHDVIGRRLFLTNLTTLGITLIVVFVVFSLVIPLYFRQNTRSELQRAGTDIVKALDTIQTLESGTSTDRQKRLQLLRTIQEIRISGKVVNARMALVDARGNIRFTNISDLQPEELQSVIQQLRNGRSAYVFTEIPFKSAENDSTGSLYLFAKTDDISGVNQGVFWILSGSLLIGGMIAFGFSVWQQRRIGKPLNALVAAVESFNVSTYAPLTLNSGDEIQTLAETFNQMAHTLKQTDEAQTRLLQDISHELKTPLMSVQGYAEAIKDGVLVGEDAEKSLDVIIDESQRLKRLVEDLLLLSKLENQESAYAFTEAAASGIISLAAGAIGGYAREHRIELQLIQEQDFTALMDQDRILQCLINILGNGVRYARSRVCITLSANDSAGTIRIEDDGKGFDPGEASHVFERFYKGSQGGAGIGLTIAKTIAEKHGGSLSARNGTSGGAEFILTIPC